MPSKKKKYNARFPAGRIKKIMQTDEEIGKVAQAVPIIISRTLELFVEELIKKTMQITMMKNARTLSPHHMKQCILSESRFDFLKDLVKSVPEVATSDDDLGSFSDNSTTVQPRQRSNSRDSTNRLAENDTPASVGPTFYVEAGDEPIRNSLCDIDEESTDSDDIDMPEKPHNDSKETSENHESVSPILTLKKDSDSEDYDT